MLSNKSYLIKAFYDWIVDSGCIPLMVVNTEYPRCNVPLDYIEDGEIVLNVLPEAIRDLKITAKKIEFQASFSGVAHLISFPTAAVLAVYAEENGQGMFFDPEEELDVEDSDDTEFNDTSAEIISDNKKSHLTLVK